MSDMKQSALLQYLNQQAHQKVDSGEAPCMSAALLVLCCYEACRESAASIAAKAGAEAEAELAQLKQFFASRKFENNRFRTLAQQVKGEKGSVLASILLGSTFTAASRKAEKEGGTVTAAHVLAEIFQNPPSALRQALETAPGESGPEPAAPAGDGGQKPAEGTGSSSLPSWATGSGSSLLSSLLGGKKPASGETAPPAGTGEAGGAGEGEPAPQTTPETTGESAPAGGGASAAAGESQTGESQTPGQGQSSGTESQLDWLMRLTGKKAGSAQPQEPPKEMDLAELTAYVKKMQEFLSGEVFGQDHAISVFTSGYFQAKMQDYTDKDHKKPSASFLFAGPAGVGKTYLAEKAAEYLKLPYKRFDMSEFSDHQQGVTLFAGSASVYGGAEPGVVTSFVDENPYCVLLFDEIEKAHLKTIHLFLQLLDAGRVKDAKMNKEVDFSKAIIIMTTNAGHAVYEGSRSRNLSGLSRKTILKGLREDRDPVTGQNLFPEAICSRFAAGNVVMFNHMEAHYLKRIVRNRAERNAARMTDKYKLEITVDDDVYSTILFAEGGSADGRTVTGRTDSFINTELYELFRLMGSHTRGLDISKLKKIHFSTCVPDEEEISSLYSNHTVPQVLVFGREELRGQYEHKGENAVILFASDIEEAMDILKKEDIEAVYVKVPADRRGEYLNIEDENLPELLMYRVLRDEMASTPVYLLQNTDDELSMEERVSFLRTGARGVCTSLPGEMEGMVQAVSDFLYQQKSMDSLARLNRVVKYGTAQTVSEDGTEASIQLINLELVTAADAQDAKKLVSSVTMPDVKFDDVIGAASAKEELKFFAEYLKHPKNYARKGLHTPKGVLLYGPPGTGKTMLAKALAAEAGLTFITAEGNQFLKKYVGEGPEEVHNIFQTARKYAPTILFIDEIDAIGRVRSGAGMEHTSDVLDALLAEMDGFQNTAGEMVFVLAATNYETEGNGPDSLDPALVRRFDRRIMVDLPKEEERLQFLQRKTKGELFGVSEETLKNLAGRSTGMSLAILNSVLELAMRDAVRGGKETVTDAILDNAFETTVSGDEKKWAPEELLRTARHEAGHAFICYASGETPSYMTIVARGNYGGYMQHANKENKGSYSKKELRDRIRVAFGGRAAELVYYGQEDGLTTGASGDLQTATAVARRIICTYGMDEQSGLSVIAPPAPGESEDPAVRRRINEILKEELDEAVRLISENRPRIDRLVDALMKENHLDGSRIQALLDQA